MGILRTGTKPEGARWHRGGGRRAPETAVRPGAGQRRPLLAQLRSWVSLLDQWEMENQCECNSPGFLNRASGTCWGGRDSG